MGLWSEARAYDFIDLARLGRTDWRGNLWALLWIAGSLVGVMLITGLPILIAAKLRLHMTITYFELYAIAVLTLAYFIGLRFGVVRGLRRPLLSIVSTDMTFEPSRVLLGVFVWVASWLIIAAPILLYGALNLSETLGALSGAVKFPPPSVWIPMVLIMLIIPFQSAGEEMIFRGWLSQSLGQFVRRSWLLMPIIGIVFSLMHGFSMGWPGFFIYVTISLLCSALSLRDGRLELAMGVHAANNIFAMLVAGLTLSHGPSSSFFHAAANSIGWAGLVMNLAEALLAYAIGLWFIRRRAARSAAAILPSAA